MKFPYCQALNSRHVREVVGDALREDTVLIYEGWWDRLGGSVNRLTGDELSDMGENATFYDARCRIVKREDPGRVRCQNSQ